MQIISGIYKHRPIKSPDNNYTHPMGNREKLALFNMVSSYLPNSSVLDTFAGTGSLGLECLSRGASRVVFVEKSPKNARLIAENLRTLGEDATKQAEIIIKPVQKINLTEKFDIIITDPPYDKFDINEVAHLGQFLKEEGILVLSHPKLEKIPLLPGLTCLSTHQYAAANLSLYKTSVL